MTLRLGLAVCRHCDDRFFWLAGVFANLGMWSLPSERLWLAHEQTQSPVMAGLVHASSLSPLKLNRPVAEAV